MESCLGPDKAALYSLTHFIPVTSLLSHVDQICAFEWFKLALMCIIIIITISGEVSPDMVMLWAEKTRPLK